jgi:hypothetical protein
VRLAARNVRCRTPEEIAAAIERRDQLAQRVQRLDRAIAKVGLQYAIERGYGAALRPERLRADVKRESRG